MLQRVSWTMSMTSLLACSEMIYRSGWVQLNDKWWLWLHTCWGELLKWHTVVGTWVKQSLVKAVGHPSNSCLSVRVVVVGPNNTSVLHLGHGAKEVSVVMVASWNAGHWFTFDRHTYVIIFMGLILIILVSIPYYLDSVWHTTFLQFDDFEGGWSTLGTWMSFVGVSLAIHLS